MVLLSSNRVFYSDCHRSIVLTNQCLTIQLVIANLNNTGDAVNTIHFRELNGVILTGHSYGGMVVTGVAGRLSERLRARVYLNAMVPEKGGESLLST